MTIFHIITLLHSRSLAKAPHSHTFLLSVRFFLVCCLFFYSLPLSRSLSQCDRIPGMRQTLSLHLIVVRSHAGLYISPLHALFVFLFFLLQLPMPSANSNLCLYLRTNLNVFANCFCFLVFFPVLSTYFIHNSHTRSTQHHQLQIRIGSGCLIRFHRLMHDFDGNVLN